MKIYIIIFCVFTITFILSAKSDSTNVINSESLGTCKYIKQELSKLKQIENDIASLKINLNKSRMDKIWDGFCNTLGAIVFAFINLIVLIYQLNKNTNKEKENTENEKKSYWYRKIILEKNIESLCEYFKESSIFYHQNTSSLSDKKYGELRKKYQDKRNQYNRLSLLLGIFKDDKIVTELNNLILEHEDLIFSDDVNEKDFTKRNKEIEKDVLQKLYLYDYSNYKTT